MSSQNTPGAAHARGLKIALCILATSLPAGAAITDTLVFNKIVADTYHAPINRGGSYRIATDGVINTADSFRGFDTFNGNTGAPVFAGLVQTGFGALPQVFETATLSLGNQFVDGGNFAFTPSLYLLLNNVDTNMSLPSIDPNFRCYLAGAKLRRRAVSDFGPHRTCRSGSLPDRVSHPASPKSLR